MYVLPNNYPVTPVRGKGTKHTEIEKTQASPLARHLVCDRASKTEILEI